MKKLLFGLAIAILMGISYIKAQTVIPSSITVHDFSLLTNGFYRIITPTDTVDVMKDTSLAVIKIITVHDTLPRICPACPVQIPCPPVIVCPVCPPPPAERVATGLTWDIITNKKTVQYNRGDNSTL